MIRLPIAALVVVVALLGGFYGGYKVGGGGTAAAASSSGTGSRTAGQAGLGGGRFTACPTTSASPSAAALRRGATGTVTNLTATSLTIHDARCNADVNVIFSSTVIIRKTTLGQVSDLAENETIAVTGTRQADGSIKANSITIVPAGSAGGGGFGAFGGGGG